MCFQVELPLAFEHAPKHLGEAGFQQLGKVCGTQLALQFRTLGQLRKELFEVSLHGRGLWIIFHMT